jgi:hypothetical protein
MRSTPLVSLLIGACSGAVPAANDAAALAVDAAAAIDAGPSTTGCWEEGLSPPCCYARSNADRLGRAQLRFVALDHDLPIALSRDAVDEVTFTMLTRSLHVVVVEIEQRDSGETTIRFGTAVRSRDQTDVAYSWPNDDAPGPGDPSRWNPRSGVAAMNGERLSSEPLVDPVTIPMWNPDATVAAEVVWANVQFDGVELSVDRSCAGALPSAGGTSVWEYGGGRFSAFAPVESLRLGALPVIGISACTFLAGTPCDRPQGEWRNQPDSRCEEGASCTFGGCDPASSCNAFRLEARVGLAGWDVR